MNTLYIISTILFLILALVSGFSLYRLTITILLATIQVVDLTSIPGKCVLTVTYTVSGTRMTSKVTVPGHTSWAKNQTVPIYINPLDLSQPKYAPHQTYTILYICTCVGLIGLVLSVYLSLKTNKETS